MKEPLDSFLVSNNYNNLNLTDKIEYGILPIKGLLESSDPQELYMTGNYFYNNMSKKIDVSEKKQSIKLAEKFFEKGLKLDTLHIPILIRLSDLSIKKYQYFKENVKSEIERSFNLMISEKKPMDLRRALYYYVGSINSDSVTVLFGYPEKAIDIGKRLIGQPLSDKNIKRLVAQDCSNLSFYLFSFKRHHPNSLTAAKMAVEADSSYFNTYTNLPIAYLLNNKYEEAVNIYMKYKDRPYNSQGFKTYKDAFLSDFDDLERRGIKHPDFEKIKELLKK